jgi:hypothetical protein
MITYLTQCNPLPGRQVPVVTSVFDDTYTSHPQTDSKIQWLEWWTQTYDTLFRKKRADLYTTFFIPKSSGGLRRIDAPSPEISEALTSLRDQFELCYLPYVHDAAFAYVHGRCTVDAVKRHQQNQSKWFLKLDFSNFFGNSAFDFVINQFSRIYPFNEVMKNPKGKLLLTQALSLCFLNGSLPQGSPLSPYITNAMMIPIDYDIENVVNGMNKSTRHFVYTRYADDLLISCDDTFDKTRIESMINAILIKHKAPFALNAKKTRYGSSSGQNWNLGVMLNKENKITIGHQKKRQFKAMLDSYIKKHDAWSIHDVQILQGHMNYYAMIEPDYISYIVTTYSAKHNINIKQQIHADLSLANAVALQV